MCIFSKCIPPKYIFPKCIFPKCIYLKCINPKCIFPKCILSKCVPPKCIFPKCIFPKCIYSKCIFAKCTQLGCLLSFASLCYVITYNSLSTVDCGILEAVRVQYGFCASTLLALLSKLSSQKKDTQYSEISTLKLICISVNNRLSFLGFSSTIGSEATIVQVQVHLTFQTQVQYLYNILKDKIQPGKYCVLQYFTHVITFPGITEYAHQAKMLPTLRAIDAIDAVPVADI